MRATKPHCTKKWLFLIGFLIISSCFVKAQCKKEASPFNMVYSDNISVGKYGSVDFVDTATNQIISSFDFIENNPFNKLNFTETNRNSYDNLNKIYSFDNTCLKDIVIPDYILILKDNIGELTQKKGLEGGSSYYAAITGKHLVVHYIFEVYWSSMVLGRSDALIVFDTKGNILHKLKTFDTNVSEWSLTKNGKFFSYAYGGVMDESLANFSDVGYKIIELQSNSLAYAENFGNKYSEIRTRNKNNIIKVTCFSENYNYIFFDFERNKKYSRVFTWDERNLWKEITNEGILIYVGKRKSNTIELVSFEEDFKVEDIR